MNLTARHAFDENATPQFRNAKSGFGAGLGGFKDSAKVQPCKATSQLRSRKALGDVTNTLRATAASSTKPAPSKAFQTVPEASIEHMAGKGWRAMEEELQQQKEAATLNRLKRVAEAASTWTTGYRCFLQMDVDGSDDDSDAQSDSGERFEETPIVVYMHAERQSQDEDALRRLRSSSQDVSSLLPDVPSQPLDLDFCWSDDDLY
ncbi:hypothetical protein Agub_g12318 [Astrephomene gubernaculifera]|uniref:Uncharacterized protein n=1 Tax=Astrephomene gubernaculifera TaxID=47775 RepID=A0AAD3DY21_9CHLO|nr:hypothetical protein Agub_g12318 [Astrephomene gubernaculifera]